MVIGISVGLFFLMGIVQMTSVYGEGLIFKQSVAGGLDAKVSDAPFIVSLRNNGQHSCGGTLIAKNWVLTASHCVVGYAPEEVVIGATKVNGEDAVETFKVERAISYPNFSASRDMANNFALIKFKGILKITPALLNEVEPELLNLPNFIVAGWDNTNEFSYFGSDLLQIVDVPFVDQKNCEKQLQDYEPNKDGYLDGTMFCAGCEDGGKEACQGDSGSPRYYKNNANDFVVAGIVAGELAAQGKDSQEYIVMYRV